jgi:hypothetical protein
VDRKTARRYVAAAEECGLVRDGGEEQLSDVLLASVCERVRPHRHDGHGAAWEVLVAHHDQVTAWLDDDKLTVVKVHELLARRGVVVPARTLHRYALEVVGVGRSARGTTVRVADGDPGVELQVDFGKMGLVPDPESGRRRVCWALIFTACYSRHCFVWLTFRQTTEAVIAGFEAAWAFFGGVFAVVIPDNMATVVERADATEPRLNQAFVEYAQARGFVVDPARVRRPQDKPRVERPLPYVRDSFFAGREWHSLVELQRAAVVWSMEVAGRRSCRSLEGAAPITVFEAVEAEALLVLPEQPFELAAWSTPKVGPDIHAKVGKALYSVPWRFIGRHLDARESAKEVQFFLDGELVKTHRWAERGKQTDFNDYPPEKVAFLMRTPAWCRKRAADVGPACAALVAELMAVNACYRLRSVQGVVGLVERHGAGRLEAACRRALEVGDPSYKTVKGILAAGTEADHDQPEATLAVVPAHLHGPQRLFDDAEGAAS